MRSYNFNGDYMIETLRSYIDNKEFYIIVTKEYIYIKNYSNDFRYIFIPKVNQPPPAKTRDEVYQLTFKDPQYVYPTIPDEFKTFGDRFFDKLKAENCKPISDYINSITPVYYLFNDKQYKVRPHNWIHYNSRPHIKQTRKPRTKKCNNECTNGCIN